MQGKLKEEVQANHARYERQPRRESLALALLRGPPQTARFSTLNPPVALA